MTAANVREERSPASRSATGFYASGIFQAHCIACSAAPSRSTPPHARITVRAMSTPASASPARVPVVPVFLPAVLFALACCSSVGLVPVSHGRTMFAGLLAAAASALPTVIATWALFGVRRGDPAGTRRLVAACVLVLVFVAYRAWADSSRDEGALAATDVESIPHMRAAIDADRPWELLSYLFALMPTWLGGGVAYRWLRARRSA